MPLLDSKDTIVRYRYSVSELYLLYEGEQDRHVLPNNRLISFNIIHDFINNAFPIFKINITLESSIYYKILKNKDNVKFKIRLQKYRIDTSGNRISMYEDYINDTFSLILNDDDNDLQEETRKKIYPNGDEGELTATVNNVEFFLFKSSFIKSTKNKINVILKDSSIQDAIGYISNEYGLSKVLMSPIDNKNMYSNLVIPPLTCTQALKYIDSFYGIYERGSVIYLDFDKTYILSFGKLATAYTKNEKKNTYIIIPEYGNLMTNEIGSVKKYNNTTDNYIVINSTTVKIMNESISNDVLVGNDALFISYNDENNIDTISEDSIQKSVIENPGMNEFFSTEYEAQINSMKNVFSLSMIDIDLDAVTPNKKFIIEFENTKLSKKYKGKYMLCSNNIYFKNKGEEFSPVATALFRMV